MIQLDLLALFFVLLWCEKYNLWQWLYIVAHRSRQLSGLAVECWLAALKVHGSNSRW